MKESLKPRRISAAEVFSLDKVPYKIGHTGTYLVKKAGWEADYDPRDYFAWTIKETQYGRPSFIIRSRVNRHMALEYKDHKVTDILGAMIGVYIGIKTRGGTVPLPELPARDNRFNGSIRGGDGWSRRDLAESVKLHPELYGVSDDDDDDDGDSDDDDSDDDTPYPTDVSITGRVVRYKHGLSKISEKARFFGTTEANISNNEIMAKEWIKKNIKIADTTRLSKGQWSKKAVLPVCEKTGKSLRSAKLEDLTLREYCIRNEYAKLRRIAARKRRESPIPVPENNTNEES